MNIYNEFIELMDNWTDYDVDTGDRWEDWDQEQLEQIIYTCLEDINFHTFNHLFVAYLYGTYEEIEQAAKIMLEHRKAGHALPNNMEWQSKNLGKYVDQLFKEEVNV
jgi:hypothetical protein